MTRTCTLHILHTNDLHSHFAQVPQIAACLHQKRTIWENEGAHVLTIDIGDHVDRMSEPTEATWGRVNTEILNQSGYQYVTIGNNEGLTLPKDRLNELYQHADFTIVLGNLREPNQGGVPDWAVPYAIHQYGDVQIAILAVTAPFTPAYELLGWEVLPPFPVLAEQIAALRSHVHAIVILSHLGYQMDVEMASQLEGIDVILGAHTHHLLEQGERVGKTLIAQTGKFGQHIGHVTLTINPADKKVTSSHAEVFDPAHYEPDQKLADFVQEETANAKRLLDTSSITLSRPFTLNWMEESPFASFLAASLRAWTHAEIGMANSGLLLTPLQAGPVTKHDLLRCLPHPINPCTVLLTGDQLCSLLERVLSPEMMHKQLRGFGFRGKVTGWMGLDGVSVEYCVSPELNIKQVKVGGHPVRAEQKYRVATVDMFMYNRMFPELLGGEEVRFYLPEVLREVVAATLSNEAMVQASFSPRYFHC
ncbi:MAG: bifunctional metallophosphatase/5'-nucleotidase [Clostridia bacterium]